MNRYVVIGAGFFGTNLAKNLAEHGAEVIVLDKNVQKTDALKDIVAKAITVDVTNKEMLARLIPTDVDRAIVCIGTNLQANLIVSLNLQSLGIPNITSKCHSEEHRKILELMNIDDVINPEEEAAKMLANKLLHPNILEQTPLKSGYTVIEVNPPKGLIGRKLKDTEIRTKFKINIIGIRSLKNIVEETKEENKKEKKETIQTLEERDLNITPDGETVIKETDIIIAVGEADKIKKYFG